MKKKLIATLLLLTLTMTTALTGCGSGDKETAGNDVSNGVESNDNTATNNDTDSNAETDTTKQEETEEIEYSEDDVIIELNGAKFSIYDEWASIEPKLQEAGFDTSAVKSDNRITNSIKGAEKLYILVNLDETENGIFIRKLTICEASENDSIRKLVKLNGYNMLSSANIMDKYEFAEGESSKFVTEDIKLVIYPDRVEWRIVKQ